MRSRGAALRATPFGLVLCFVVFSLDPIALVRGQSCAPYTGCTNCTQQAACGFCASSSSCLVGDFAGPYSTTCPTAQWKYLPSDCQENIPDPCRSWTSCVDCAHQRTCGWCTKNRRCATGNANGTALCAGANPNIAEPTWVFFFNQCPTSFISDPNLPYEESWWLFIIVLVGLVVLFGMVTFFTARHYQYRTRNPKTFTIRTGGGPSSSSSRSDGGVSINSRPSSSHLHHPFRPVGPPGRPAMNPPGYIPA